MSRATPLLIAHRGASAVAPESTRAAIQAAVRAGAMMIELDVQLTLDRRLVIFHDDRLERTTNGTGRVTTTRYTDLRRLDAGTWFHPRFRGERILLVTHVLRLVPHHIRLNLELKRTRNPAVLIRHFVALVRRQRAVRRIVVSSFDPRLLHLLRRTRMARALICRRDADRSLQHAIQLRCVAWHPFHTLVTPRRLARAHAAGLRVHAWTVDELSRARQLLHVGVDGLFTNNPQRLRVLYR